MTVTRPGYHIAIGLLALGVARHYGYLLADQADHADIWNAAGAVTLAAMLIALAWRWRGPVLLVVAWWVAEEVMVAGCSLAYMVQPWIVGPGQDQCSALIGLDISKISAAVIAALAFSLYTVKPEG